MHALMKRFHCPCVMHSHALADAPLPSQESGSGCQQRKVAPLVLNVHSGRGAQVRHEGVLCSRETRRRMGTALSTGSTRGVAVSSEGGASSHSLTFSANACTRLRRIASSPQVVQTANQTQRQRQLHQQRCVLGVSPGLQGRVGHDGSQPAQHQHGQQVRLASKQPGRCHNFYKTPREAWAAA